MLLQYIGYDGNSLNAKLLEIIKNTDFFSSFWKGMIDLTLYQKKALDILR